jgi:hypothetical protein
MPQNSFIPIVFKYNNEMDFKNSIFGFASSGIIGLVSIPMEHINAILQTSCLALSLTIAVITLYKSFRNHDLQYILEQLSVWNHKIDLIDKRIEGLELKIEAKVKND